MWFTRQDLFDEYLEVGNLKLVIEVYLESAYYLMNPLKGFMIN